MRRTTLTVEECDKAMEGIVCERWHPYRGFGKAKGRLDLSEAPQAYKDIECVIDAERDLVEPLVRLVPIAKPQGLTTRNGDHMVIRLDVPFG